MQQNSTADDSIQSWWYLQFFHCRMHHSSLQIQVCLYLQCAVKSRYNNSNQLNFICTSFISLYNYYNFNKDVEKWRRGLVSWKQHLQSSSWQKQDCFTITFWHSLASQTPASSWIFDLVYLFLTLWSVVHSVRLLTSCLLCQVLQQSFLPALCLLSITAWVRCRSSPTETI